MRLASFYNSKFNYSNYVVIVVFNELNIKIHLILSQI